MKKIKWLFLLAALLTPGVKASAFVPIRYVQISTGTLQPGTTAGFFVSSGTANSLTTTDLKIGSSIGYNGAVSSGTFTDKSTSTWNGVYTFNGTAAYNASLTGNGTNAFKGATTSGDGTVGYWGEVLASTVTFANRINAAGSNTQTDLTSLTLTTGDWDVEFCISLTANGATVTTAQVGSSPNSGTSGSGLTFGDNAFVATLPTGAAGTNDSTTSFHRRINLTSTVTFYLKFIMIYTVATPQAYGYIHARRSSR